MRAVGAKGAMGAVGALGAQGARVDVKVGFVNKRPRERSSRASSMRRLRGSASSCGRPLGVTMDHGRDDGRSPIDHRPSPTSTPYDPRMQTIQWGMIGCGDVTEVKSGPALQKATGSALVAVMRRDRAKAEDYARRHDVPRVHTRAEELFADPEVRRRLYRNAAVEPLRSCVESGGCRQAMSGRKADGAESRRMRADDRGIPRPSTASLGGLLPARAAAVPESARAPAWRRRSDA